MRIIESNKGQIPKFRFLSPGACGQPQSPYCLTSAGGNVQQSQTVPLASKYLRWLLKGGECEKVVLSSSIAIIAII